MPVFVRGIPRAGVNCVLFEPTLGSVRDRPVCVTPKAALALFRERGCVLGKLVSKDSYKRNVILMALLTLQLSKNHFRV